MRASCVAKISSLASKVHDAPLHADSVRVSQAIGARAFALVRHSVLDWTADIVLAAISALILVGPGAILA